MEHREDFLWLWSCTLLLPLAWRPSSFSGRFFPFTGGSFFSCAVCSFVGVDLALLVKAFLGKVLVLKVQVWVLPLALVRIGSHGNLRGALSCTMRTWLIHSYSYCILLHGVPLHTGHMSLASSSEPGCGHTVGNGSIGQACLFRAVFQRGQSDPGIFLPYRSFFYPLLALLLPLQV